MSGTKRKAFVKALVLAFIFAFLLSWELFLCLTLSYRFFDLFVSSIMPIYMAAITVIVYPVFRYKTATFPYFSILALLACAIIGVPSFVFVGSACDSFGLGTGIAYFVYGLALAIGISTICLCDAMITAMVRFVKRKREHEN